jgi:predicted O-methyltransferase YrrM
LLDFDQTRNAASTRILAALKAAGCAREISSEIRHMARALAATKKAGAILCMGEGAGEVGAWILEGMDHSSGFVALVQDEREATVIQRELDCDVRASVHLQDAASFLLDVRAHHFDLIVDLIADEHPKTLRLGLGLLRAGGVYLASNLESLSHETLPRCDQEPGEQPSPLDLSDFEIARWGDHLKSMIIVRRTERVRKKRRSRPPAR